MYIHAPKCHVYVNQLCTLLDEFVIVRITCIPIPKPNTESDKYLTAPIAIYHIDVCLFNISINIYISCQNIYTYILYMYINKYMYVYADVYTFYQS